MTNRASSTQLAAPSPEDVRTNRRSVVNYVRFALALAFVPLLSACPAATCPSGEVAVQGRCYPQEAVDAVGGGVPVLCAAACEGASPHCDYHDGTCVGCADDAQCPSLSAASCDGTSRECSPCADDGDCARFAGSTHCDVAAGRCVECDATNEASACGPNSCDAMTGRCTSTPRHSRVPCDTCRSDSECGNNQHCAAFSWLGTTPHHVCLWDATVIGGCATSPTSPYAPYVHANVGTSVHGVSVNVCEPPSVCEAVRAYSQAKSCTYRTECAAENLAADCINQKCTMSCSSILVGYAGCAASDNCDDGLYCRANP